MKIMQKIRALAIASLLSVSMAAFADAPLSEVIDFSLDQARSVSAIQEEARLAFAVARGQHNRVRRALRRAEADHDAEQIQALSAELAHWQQEMRDIRNREDAQIRAVLTAEQLPAFEDWIAQRESMVGSSRDTRIIP